MSDDIERIVQRDLDRLPLLPPERWVPQPKRRSALMPSWLRPLALVPATLMIALVAIALGTQLADWRAQRELAASRPAIGAPVATSEGSTPPRCADSVRPQSEITAAGLLPHEPRSPLLECVLFVERNSRVYRLTDGRSLKLFEYPVGLPFKPSGTPDQTGTRVIDGQSWSWLTINGQTVLSTTLSDRVYVDLSVPTGSDLNADLAILQSIASTLRASGLDCGTARMSNAGSPYDQALLDCVWAAYARGEAARLSITMVTTEGHLVPTALLAVPGGRSIVTRDLTADNFSSPADRVVNTYSCTALTRRPWATDPKRYVFELSDCLGPAPTATFP